MATGWAPIGCGWPCMGTPVAMGMAPFIGSIAGGMCGMLAMLGPMMPGAVPGQAMLRSRGADMPMTADLGRDKRRADRNLPEQQCANYIGSGGA